MTQNMFFSGDEYIKTKRIYASGSQKTVDIILISSQKKNVSEWSEADLGIRIARSFFSSGSAYFFREERAKTLKSK